MPHQFHITLGSVACCAAAILPPGAHADTIVHQAFDRQNGLLSDRDTVFDLAQTADDFELSAPAILDVLHATFIVDRRVPPVDWELLILENDRGEPGELVELVEGGDATDTGGDWDRTHHPELGIFTIEWDLDRLNLDAGHYWVIARAVGDNELFQCAWWGTSHTDRPEGREAMFLSPDLFVFDWTPWSDVDEDLLLDNDVDFRDVPFDTAWSLLGESADIADIERVRIKRGSFIEGTIGRLQQSDDAFLVTLSDTDADPDTPNRLKMQIIFDTDAPGPLSLDILIESLINFDGGSTKIKLKNWDTGRFERIGRFPADFEERVDEIANLDAPKFVNRSGRIKMLIQQTLDNRPGNTPFLSFFDVIQVRAE